MKIEWHFEGVASADQITANIAYSKSLCYPHPSGTGKTRLAVLGGGPSAKDSLQELREFDGDIWIIGSAFQWARENGIEGVYFNIDPSLDCVLECKGAKKAILGTSVNARLFDALQGAEISVFDLVETPERMNHGVTTATAVPELALLCDYTEIIFYGCESSFGDTTHAYKKAMHDRWMVVKSNGQSFKTNADYFAQAEFLATIIRAFPKQFKERSGGFLRAMVATMEYDVTHATRALYETLNFS